jgi:hypothetical protein
MGGAKRSLTERLWEKIDAAARPRSDFGLDGGGPAGRGRDGRAGSGRPDPPGSSPK